MIRADTQIYKFQGSFTRERFSSIPKHGSLVTHLPVISGGKTRHLTEVLTLHPLVLGHLGDAAHVGVHGRAAAGVAHASVGQGAGGTMYAARRGGRRGLGRSLGRAQCGGNVQGNVCRARLAIVQRERVVDPGRGGRVVDGRRCGGVDGSGMAVGDLRRVGRRGGSGGGGGRDVSGH